MTVCYVDDFLVFTKRQKLFEEPKKKLSEKAMLKTLVELKRFLEMELTWSVLGQIRLKHTK